MLTLPIAQGRIVRQDSECAPLSRPSNVRPAQPLADPEEALRASPEGSPRTPLMQKRSDARLLGRRRGGGGAGQGDCKASRGTAPGSEEIRFAGVEERPSRLH